MTNAGQRRAIATTNADLAKAIGEGTSREDLYYRLNVICIPLAPFRERKENIPLLAQHFLRQYWQAIGKATHAIPPETTALLIEHDCPGIVRELENAVEHAIIVASASSMPGICSPTYTALMFLSGTCHRVSPSTGSLNGQFEAYYTESNARSPAGKKRAHTQSCGSVRYQLRDHPSPTTSLSCSSPSNRSCSSWEYSATSLNQWVTSLYTPTVQALTIQNAKEIEFDGVAKDGEILVHAICEHVEHAGVHSGDATLVLPPLRTYMETIRQVRNTARKIADTLNITGPFNIQFIA